MQHGQNQSPSDTSSELAGGFKHMRWNARGQLSQYTRPPPDATVRQEEQWSSFDWSQNRDENEKIEEDSKISHHSWVVEERYGDRERLVLDLDQCCLLLSFTPGSFGPLGRLRYTILGRSAHIDVGGRTLSRLGRSNKKGNSVVLGCRSNQTVVGLCGRRYDCRRRAQRTCRRLVSSSARRELTARAEVRSPRVEVDGRGR
jgi:hypothetical protein